MRRSGFILLVLLALALAVSYRNQLYVVPAAIVLILAVDKAVFRVLLKWKLLVFLAILVFGVPVFAGNKDAVRWGIRYSTEIFQMSLVMVYRSIIILMAIKMFTRRISIQQIAGALEKARLRQLSQVFALAMTILPGLRDLVSVNLRECRSNIRRWYLPGPMFRCLVLLVARIIQYAETLDTTTTPTKRPKNS